MATMTDCDAIAGAASDAPEMVGRAGRVFANLLFLQRPRRFNRIQVGRVRRQVQQAHSMGAAGRADADIVVRRQVVHDQDIAGPEARQQLPREPRDETVGVGRRKHRLQRDPAALANRAEQRERLPPIHWDALDILGATLHPGVRPIHRHMHARFVEEHQACQ
jgi:hypothetical protein